MLHASLAHLVLAAVAQTSQAQRPLPRVQIPSSFLWTAIAVAGIALVLGVVGLLLRELILPRLFPQLAQRGERTRTAQYQKVASLLTEAELRFFAVLRQSVSPSECVMTKVRIADLLSPVSTGKDGRAALNRVLSKHADFVICDAATLKPKLVIELDDSSHSRADRVARDTFIEQAYSSAALPVLRVPVKRSYSRDELVAQIQALITSST